MTKDWESVAASRGQQLLDALDDAIAYKRLADSGADRMAEMAAEIRRLVDERDGAEQLIDDLIEWLRGQERYSFLSLDVEVWIANRREHATTK